ncbi:X-ray radiation resistance-associated protein 1-like [Dendronephthya gigantea]|uniref:X-ray radiation resistance-associated protein 1-like n=1 Tax=Dendronephthya gigantea TaxID=151771 RepID=UPI00106CCE0E|nr:X-ray radiation resistance-associated protein 1-like [Dendronephthya gigantea]
MTELGRNIGLSGQCFPVRSLTRNNAAENGYAGGAWLVAYRAEQRRRFKAVLCREPDVALSDKPSESKKSSKSRKTNEGETRKKLDGIYLMNACYINDPLDLCSVNIAGKGLTLVNEDDFSMFSNVIHIDAGDNNLQLVHFRRFPNLKTLELPLNKISGTVVLQDKDFVWLETLDLSCNHLTTNDVLALGVLPALKVLHLTGNQLSELPPEMCRSFPLNKGQRQSRFGNLEKLWLDQNHLTDLNTFTCLAGLKRLKYLNLEYNNIASVPHLRLLKPKTSILRSNYSHDVIDEEIDDVNSKISILEEILYSGKNDELTEKGDVIETECSQGHFQDRHTLPFPSLLHLNLANNEIEEEEGLLTLSTWPRLEEVVIWGNPVASRGREGPPIVNYQLGLVAGIEVARHKPSKKGKDSSSLLSLTKNSPRKIADVPTISQTRNLLMLEGPKQHDLGYSIKPLPPIPSSVENDRRVASAPAGTRDVEDDERSNQETLRSSDGDRSTGKEQSSFADDSSLLTQSQRVVSPEERVFLTQAEEVENDDVLFYNNEQQKSGMPQKKSEKTVPKSKHHISKKYQGYEELLNIDEQYSEDIELPKTVHGNVRALQYTLDHPLTFTQQSARYRDEQTTKDKQRWGLSRYQNTRPTTVEELGSILDKMRTHTKTVESNLDNVLKGNKRPRNKKELKEAKKLLNEVQTKYNEVRCDSLQSTRVAGDIFQKQGISIKPAVRKDHIKDASEEVASHESKEKNTN